MADQINISGLDEFQSQVKKLGDLLSAELPQIVMDAASIVEREIRTRAPVRTGALVEHINTTSGQADRNHASAIVQVDASGKSGDEHYAIFEEYGTSKTPAKPFFRPGVAAATPKVEQFARQRILEVIDKADRA